MSGGQRRTIASCATSRAELELRERLALHAMIADGTNRAVIVTDRNLRIVYTNAAFAECSVTRSRRRRDGGPTNCLRGRYTDRRALARLRRRIVAENGGEEEILAYDRNGDEIWLSANVKAFRNARGRIKYMFALADRYQREPGNCVRCSS